MNEVQRYLRYTIPGLVCFLVLTVALIISDKPRILQTESIDFSQYAGLSVLILLASVPLGYLLAQAYFTLHWTIHLGKYHPIDHYSLLEGLEKKGKIEIHDGDKSFLLKSLSNSTVVQRRHAWTILNQSFWSLGKLSDEQKRLKDWIDRLVGFTHSMGTTIIGLFLAGIAWAILHSYIDQFAPWKQTTDFVPIIVLAVLIALTLPNYHRTRKSLQATGNTTMLSIILSKYEDLNRSNESDRSKVRIYYHL